MTTVETARTAAAPGRTRIAPRALDRVVSAVAADALRVPARHVGVHLDDDAGNLSLRVTTPIGVPTLPRVMDEPNVLDRDGGSVLDRAKNAQEQIRNRVQQLTGSSIARVIVQISGIHIRQERRVR